MLRTFRRRFVLVLIAATAATLLLQARQGGPSPTGVTIRFVPPELRDRSWLDVRRAAQVAAFRGDTTFHDFQFTDRLAESGITFRHRFVDDAGKAYKAVHYDHGNGLAIADVERRSSTRSTSRPAPPRSWGPLAGPRP